MKITVEMLHRLLSLDHETGRLFWKERDATMFQSRNRDPAHYCTRWNTKYAGKEALACRSDGYCHGTILGVNVVAHRVVFAMTHGHWPTAFLDHINCVRDDNRISNLREATPTQNSINRPRPRDNTSGIKGVSWSNASKRWTAQIGFNKRLIYLGGFQDKEEAAAAYAKASAELHGEFGRTD